MRAFDRKPMQRRHFLQLLSGVAAAPLVGYLCEPAHGAGPFADYRALVCLFLVGGNDAHNMIVPLDSRYAAYAANRGPLALPQASLEGNGVADPVQGPFGFHPRLSNARALFSAGKLAVISNVGVLLRPTTNFDYQNRTQLPPLLFSHHNMIEHWHTCHPQAPVNGGWGGRLADVLQSANTGPLSAGIATANAGVFLKGGSTVGYRVGTYVQGGYPIAQRIRAWRDGNLGANPQAVYENLITMARTNRMEDQFGDVATRAVEVNAFVQNALYNGPLPNGQYEEKIPINTVFPAGNPLAAQLRSVAMMIAARQALGAKRQIFFVSLGSFDNHSDQYDVAITSPFKPGPGDPAILFGRHADLLTQVDVALKAFYDATVELGVQNSVTTFTESDFGRTLTANGKGSDHGWGAHQLVMGGAVSGGKIYGTFHNLQIGTGNPADAGQGRLIPDYSVEQYAGTLSKWLGASDTELNSIFPNRANFSGLTDLGFMA